MRWLSFALASLLLVGSSARAGEPKIVLVVYSNTRLLPANVEADRSLREVLADSNGPSAEVDAEFLDIPRFGGSEYVEIFATYLRQKYAVRRPSVIVAGGGDALLLLVRHRAQLFPEVPIVHMGATASNLAELPPLPPDVVGVVSVFDMDGTIEQALRWHPDARRLVVVAGARQTAAESAELHAGVARFADRVELDFLEGLPIEELRERLAALGPHSVVFTWGFFWDGAGRQFTPRASAEIVARATSAPVYAPYDTFIGTGVVGGVVPSFAGMGRQGGEIVREILGGAKPASLKLPQHVPTRVELDWPQARRFGIAESAVPPGAVLHFKEPTFWETYRNIALGGLAVMALQAGLITALLVERRQRRRTAAALDESERRMSLAARAAGLSTWVWDFGRDEPAGRDTPLAADRDEVEKAARDAFARDQDLSVEYRVQRPDGEVRWLTAYARADRGGDGPRLFGTSRDVTERKRTELAAEQDRAALRHMTRVSMLGQLSASIAHQLNQPLAAILSNAEAARQLLARESIDVAELREICDDIVGAEDRAAEVIRRLSALFRRGEVQLDGVDVNELVSETLELARTELVIRHVTLQTELAPDLAPVSGGRVQLQQVFLNLVVNGADAMAQTPESERRLNVRTEAKNGEVRVWVSDSGTGILARDIQKVFDPFWTTKSGGMGMGLAICRSIVDSHRGTLTAANNPERGATFCVALPALPE